MRIECRLKTEGGLATPARQRLHLVRSVVTVNHMVELSIRTMLWLEHRSARRAPSPVGIY